MDNLAVLTSGVFVTFSELHQCLSLLSICLLFFCTVMVPIRGLKAILEIQPGVLL